MLLLLRSVLLEPPALVGYALSKRKGECFGGKDQWNSTHIHTQTES
jgi:hypothetical protein